MGATLERFAAMAALVALACAFAVGSPESGKADHYACHLPNRGWGFDTYEFEDYGQQYGRVIELAARGLAVPQAYTLSNGEVIDVTYQGVESGPRSARLPADKANSIPPSLYKAIAWIESDYGNASHSTPYGGVGSILLSMDCGYGIGQITSGMGHLAAPPALDVRVPSARQAIIGTHPMFNVAEGIRILADKWNNAPDLRPVAGNGDPLALEDWYYAVWSYNGFAFSNHPLNPAKDPLRGTVWNCGDPNAPGYGVFNRSDYTYNEVVYGCLRYPPVAKGATYPPPLGQPGAPPPAAGGAKFEPGDAGVVTGTGNCLNLRAEPASPTIVTCLSDGTVVTVLGGPAAANGLTWWNIQAGEFTGWSADEFLTKVTKPDPEAPVNPEGRLWPPQVFTMPSLTVPQVASALTAENYNSCSDGSFDEGCASMDFPTTIPELEIVPHFDTTPPVDPALAAVFLGNPQLQVVGDRAVSITASTTSATSSAITVRNTGTWIAPFRVRTSASWLIVRHPSDPPGRVVDGGVAIGSETDVVVQKTPRIATRGRDSELQITVDAANLPEGQLTGTIIIEPLLGGGGITTITVQVTRDNTGGGAPGPGFKSVLPGITYEGSP